MSRVRRSSLNFACQLVSTATGLAAALIATPRLLRWLGDEKLGAYRAAVEWMGYLSLLELGIGGAMLPLIARALARKDEARLGGVVGAGFRGYRYVTLAVLVFGTILALVINWLVPTSSDSAAQDLRRAMFVALLALLVLPISPVRAIWDAEQRGYMVSLTNALQLIIITLLAMQFAWRGWGVTGQMWALVIGGIVTSLLMLILTVRRHPKVISWFFHSDPAASEALWKLNWPTLAMNVSGRVGLLTDNIVIGYFLGPVLVVPFYLTQRLAQIAQGQLQSIGNATWAGLVEVRERDGHDAFKTRVLELTRFIAALAVVAMVPFIAYNGPFIGLWVGASRFAGYWLTVIVACNVLLQATFSFWGWIFSGTGAIAKVIPMTLTAAAVNFGMSLLLTFGLARRQSQWALLGPVLGTLIAFICVNLWWMPRLLKRDFDVSMTDLYIALAKPVCFGAVLAAGFGWVAQVHPPASWFSLIWQTGGVAIICLIMQWLLVFPPTEKQRWRARIRHLARTGRS